MKTHSILDEFSQHWWVLLLRGIFAIAFGLMAFALPGLTLLTLVLIFGSYAFLDGMMAIWVGARSKGYSLMLLGLVGVIVGFYTFVSPGITAFALLYLIAVWAMVRGFFEILTAIQLRKVIPNEWAMLVGGIVSVLFGVAIVANPGAGVLAMLWFIGAFAVVFGVLMMLLAFRVRSVPHDVGRVAHV
jgi:uncharacterized membrane protein HdeD (DUF308 family)